MKKNLFLIMFAFLFGLSAIFILSMSMDAEDKGKDIYQEQLVSLNEIQQLAKKDDSESKQKLNNKILHHKEAIVALQMKNEIQGDRRNLAVLYIISVFYTLTIFIFIYIKIIRPFKNIENYLEEIANGNLDIPLSYERTNFFGEFTWAFDHMRKEIIRARACEKEAIDNNKTVIATLSHDIKAPISSIRAYAEGLDANLDSGPEKRRKYISVIIIKCDEVTKLTNDLFLHSISDMEMLKVKMENVKLKPLLQRIVSELHINNDKIIIEGEVPDVILNLDPKRFEQVIENIISNSVKYAPKSEIIIKVKNYGDKICINIEDFGGGISDEDMPFIFDKFYRGKNVGDNQGSGLGLYIVRYIMAQMGGEVEVINSKEGLKVILSLAVSS